MKHFVIYATILFLPLLFSPDLDAVDAETQKIMPFVTNDTYVQCASCHNTNETSAFTSPARACATYCMKCHKDMGAHHPVLVEIKGDLPKELRRLTKKGEITCYTCHDLTGGRFSGVMYKSESLFEKMFVFPARYKTYYLVIRNHEGGLCKSCH